MRTIIVDDEPVMLKKFERLSRNIPGLELAGAFRDPLEALSYMAENPVELVFLDIDMPVMNGVELAKRLKSIRSDLLIVFITAYTAYIREANRIGSDYYLVKPYDGETLAKVVKNMRLLAQKQRKSVYIRTFGRFNVFKDGHPIRLSGKAKEILALVVSKCGQEISNEEIFATVWEDKPYSHGHMKTYFNALKRLKETLRAEALEQILISTARGQMADPSQFDCDYYDIKIKKMLSDDFAGEFMAEYSWSESVQAFLRDYEYTPF